MPVSILAGYKILRAKFLSFKTYKHVTTSIWHQMLHYSFHYFFCIHPMIGCICVSVTCSTIIIYMLVFHSFKFEKTCPFSFIFLMKTQVPPFFFSIEWIGLVSLSLDIDYCYGGIWLLLYFPFVLDWIVFSTYVTQDFFFFSLNFNYSPRIYLKLGFTWIFYFYFVTRNTLDLQIYFILYVKKRWFSD